MMLVTAVMLLLAEHTPIGDESSASRLAQQDVPASATKRAPDFCGEAHATEVVQYIQQLCDASELVVVTESSCSSAKPSLPRLHVTLNCSPELALM